MTFDMYVCDLIFFLFFGEGVCVEVLRWCCELTLSVVSLVVDNSSSASGELLGFTCVDGLLTPRDVCCQIPHWGSSTLRNVS